MEIEAWIGLGPSWGLLGEAWEPFGLPRPSGTEKRSQMTKNDRVWAPILASIFDMFLYFLMFFCVLFLVSILMAAGTDFSLNLMIFRSVFHNWPDCLQIRKMSFWYSIYNDLSTSASWKMEEKLKILGNFLDIFLKMATDIIFHCF